MIIELYSRKVTSRLVGWLTGSAGAGAGAVSMGLAEKERFHKYGHEILTTTLLLDARLPVPGYS